MSGSLPKIVVILLAVGTYSSLAFLMMRFALRGTRVTDVAAVAERRHRAAPLPAVAEPVPTVLAALRQAGLEAPNGTSPTALARSAPLEEHALTD